jgi:hypothetical protein
MWAGTTSMTAKNHEGLAWGRAKKTGGMPLNNLAFLIIPFSGMAGFFALWPVGGLWLFVPRMAFLQLVLQALQVVDLVTFGAAHVFMSGHVLHLS